MVAWCRGQIADGPPPWDGPAAALAPSSRSQSPPRPTTPPDPALPMRPPPGAARRAAMATGGGLLEGVHAATYPRASAGPLAFVALLR